jgi:4-hydroxymandelate oxidase
VLRADDARRCVQAGAAAIWVSNHGGRQLDRAVTTASALPGIVAAVEGAAEVYADGGVHSGLDVLAALALGADAVFLGRLPVWALVDGQAGVARLHAELLEETAEAFRLAGCRTVADTRGIAVAPTAP